MKSDIEIAQEAKMKPITEIAASLGLADDVSYKHLPLPTSREVWFAGVGV